MKNTIPSPISERFSFSENLANRLHKHESTIGMMHNTESVVRLDLGAARVADNIYQTAKATRIAATSAQDVADENGRAFVMKARDVLKTVIGNSWSQAWEQAGFVEQSLAVPGTLAARTELIKRLQLYFANNPTKENLPLRVTNAKPGELHVALSNAVSAANACRGDAQVKKQARDAALNSLTKRLRGVIAELSQLISDTDGRWLDMELNMPGAVQLPEIVEGVVLEPSATGHLRIRWDASPRANRYRIFKQVVGANPDFVPAATVNELTTDLNTFSPGNVVRVRVTAVNEAGESLPSEVLEKLVA